MGIFKKAGLIGALCASGMMAMTTGCASGGFSLTRQYARWVNSQHIVIRIILYLLTSVVFAVTLLVDVVIFNTMDFWQGRVSQGIYEFSGEGKTFHVEHKIHPGSSLKESLIKVADLEGKLLQEVRLQELVSGEIEMYVDGILRAKASDLNSLPQVAHFDVSGKTVKQVPLWAEVPMKVLAGR